MAKRIMRAFKLNEISAVDRPAQAHARMAIMKRADSADDANERFNAHGDGPVSDRLMALYDNAKRGNPHLTSTANFAAAWNQLSDAERDQIREEEAVVAAALAAENEALRRKIVQKQSAEEATMTTFEEVQSLAKDHGIGIIAKGVISASEQGVPVELTEAEFTKLVGDCALKDRRSGETPEQAFTRVFSDKGPDGLALRKAHAIVKNFPGVAITQPRTVSGAAALSNDAGLDQLKGLIAAEMATAPWLSIQQATARVKAAAAATASARNAARING